MSRPKLSILPLTDEEMEARIRQTEHAVSLNMMRALLNHENLRPEVKDLIQKAITIHNLNTP